MDLQNVLPHMANASVLVNGHEYKTDAHGIVRAVSDADAQKMLLNKSAWRIHVDRQAVQEAKPVESPAPERPITVPDARAPVPPAPEPLPVPEIKPVLGKPGKRR